MLQIDGNSLTIDDVFNVAVNKDQVSLSECAETAINISHDRLLKIIAGDQPVYGINTGFGIFANRVISLNDSIQLNRNLILSHAVATGQPLLDEIVRAALLIRANALAKGYSGINMGVIQTLVGMLNRGVIPVVLDKGSLGSSGDLCMLAQVAMVLSKNESFPEADSGRAVYEGKTLPGHIAMTKAGLERQVLMHKDGLALLNGATFSAAILSLVAHEMQFLCDLADVAVSLSLEAICGRSDAFHPAIHQARGLEGQLASAARIHACIQGSMLVNSHDHVQDPYSLRCAPQVHGAARETLSGIERVVAKEINAATDNPLIIDDQQVISGGNFHGEPLGFQADFASIALAELAAISERRIFRLLDSTLNNGLPQMLVDGGDCEGINSGVMMLQYTAAALVLENQVLATPDSIRSLPTSANQEDHNANSYLAAFHAWQIMDNVFKVLAAELFTSIRGIELRIKHESKIKLGERTDKVFSLLREVFPYQPLDQVWGEKVDRLYELLSHDFSFRQKFLNCIY